MTRDEKRVAYLMCILFQHPYILDYPDLYKFIEDLLLFIKKFNKSGGS